MAYEHKEGSGALFRNDKGDNPARPDYRGDLMVGGVLYEVSGWIKPVASDPEKRMLSLAAKPKMPRQPSAPPQRRTGIVQTRQPQPSQGSGFDDFEDAPF